MSVNPWTEMLAHIRARTDEEDFRRWFSQTVYASDSGDQITVWVPTEPVRRHLQVHFQNRIDEALAALDRSDTHIRFVVTGLEDDDFDDQDI